MPDLSELKPALRKAVEEYLSDCGRRGYSKKTLVTYSAVLARFFVWLAEAYPSMATVADISKEAISDYQMHLFKREPLARRKGRKGKRLATETQYHWLGTVLWFLRWLLQQEKMLINPGASIQLPKRAKRIPRNYLSIREVQKLLKAADLTTHIGLRNRAILEVFYSTGIRAGELRRLKVEDLNLQEGWLAVREGKGSKDRVVPIGKAAVYFLLSYLEKSRTALLRGKDHPFVFTTQFGTPISYDSIQILMKKAGKQAGIKRGVTAHSLRHTCATLMLRGHADIRHIQELLGHSSLSSTQIYTRVEIGDLKKVHARCHPREKEPIEKK